MNPENATREELIAEVRRLTEEREKSAGYPGLDAVPLPVFSKDLSGKYLSCNSAFETFCGRMRADILGKTIDDLAPPVTAAAHKAKDNELLFSKGIIHYESALRDAAGRTRSIIIYKSLVLDPLGNPLYLTGTVLEVTALRETELSLDQLWQRVHSIIEAADEPIWAIDINRKITIYNRAFSAVLESMYGASVSVGEGIDDVIPVSSFPQENRYWNDLLERAMQGITFSHEFSYVLGSELQHMIITCYPVRNGTDLAGMAFFCKMVTQVRNAEEKALEASEFSSKILEASPIGIVVFDSVGICLSVNRSSSEILGTDVSSLIGKNINQILQWKQNGLHDIALACLGTGNGERAVLHTSTMNGRNAWLDCRFVPFQSRSGKHLLLLISDITENRQIEDDTKHIMHELKQSNAELERFAYVASHDLQEPLRVIASYLQLIERRYSDKLDDKGRDFISRTVAGAKRMQGMIEDLLLYSRVMTRGGVFEDVLLSDSLTDAVRNLGVAIKKSKAEIQVENLPSVSADKSQMIRLFQNLIGNAVKFCDKERPKVKIVCESCGVFWLISVHDNGIGIHEEFFDRIFHVFQRLHTSDQYSGSGIGLAVCQRIVQRHGGVLTVKSVPGEGSVFSFTLPKERD